MQPRNNRSFPIKATLAVALMAAFVFSPRPALADDPKIASVDLKLIYTNLQETIDTQRDLTDLQKQLDAMVKAHHDELAPADPKNAPKLSRDDLDAKELEYNRQEQALKAKITRKQCHQLAKAWNDMRAAITDLAQARKLDLVLSGQNAPLPLGAAYIPNAETVMKLMLGRDFAYTDVDISAEVIAAVNKNYKSTAPPLPALPTTSMKVGAGTYQLEIAGDDTSREHGMMERDAVPAGHGMIFVFPDLAYRNFWMHHTRFPLDVIFADDKGKVVSVLSMKPYDETGIPSGDMAKYAIELPAGGGASVKVGDTLSIPPQVNAALKK